MHMYIHTFIHTFTHSYKESDTSISTHKLTVLSPEENKYN